MKFLPDTDIQYFYNINQIPYTDRYLISNMIYVETTFEVRKQKLKRKDVIHSLCNYYYY